MHITSLGQTTQLARRTQSVDNGGGGIAVDPTSAKTIDASSIVRTADPKLIAQARSWAVQPSLPAPLDDLSLQYATLTKNGQTIATVYKDGVMMTPNSVHVPADLVNEGSGKALADARIKQVLAALGGEIVYR